MALAREVIDVDEHSELHRILEELRTAHTALMLRKRGEAVAVLRPLASSARELRTSKPSDADVEAFRATGGWRAIVDVERFLKDNEESHARAIGVSVIGLFLGDQPLAHLRAVSAERLDNGSRAKFSRST